MFNFIINFNWISLFAIFASRIHVIINAYFFLSQFLANHFTFFIYNFKCMISSTFFIIFVSSFLMFWNMFLIFISCIIILNLSRRKIVVEITFLIQKLLNFNIFLLSLKIFLKIINFLNFLISTIFFRAINVFLMFNLHIRIIIFIAFIFCICFIFCFFFNLCYQFHFFIWFSFRKDVDFTQEKRRNRNFRLFNDYFCSNIFFDRVFRLFDHSFQLFDHFF